MFRPNVLIRGEIRLRDRERFLNRRGTLVVPGEKEWMINRCSSDLTSRSLRGKRT